MVRRTHQNPALAASQDTAALMTSQKRIHGFVVIDATGQLE
jgi:hypothetical protein